ncbi:MAG: PSP1 domain-containing protein [Bacilli bacterium]|jgi:cell fate regulator YaaT (PSP1 superfamily)
MNDMINNMPLEENNGFFVGVKFNNLGKSYFFSTEEGNLKIGDFVVVETVRGLELGTVSILPRPINEFQLSFELKPIIRKATINDVEAHEQNMVDAKEAYALCEEEIEYLDLPMRLISCEYTLDKSKVIFSYSADNYVDFRELLKVLASRLRTRIELRQIGPRDKAKMIGGFGLCGRPICCTAFLSEFDGISISRAKNQMLALNIPKLSGHCGKLICCLKFEDDAYTEAKKDFPNLNYRFFHDNILYRVTAINIIKRTVRIESADTVEYLTLEEYDKLKKSPAK